MKKLIGMGLVAFGAAFMTGCVATALPPIDRRVTVAESLWYDVQVTDVRCARGGSDHLTFQANVVNLTSHELWLDWKVVWLDADGIEIDSVVNTWQSMAIAPKDIRGMKGTAPHPNAADMRFYVRPVQR